MTDAARPPLPDPSDPEVLDPGPAIYFVTSVRPGPTSQFVELEVENEGAVRSASLGTWTDAPSQGHLEPHERFPALRATAPEVHRVLFPDFSFAVRLEEVRDGAQINDHVRVRVFAGPDPEHRALCGVLVMLRGEAEALQVLLGAARR